MVLPVEMAVEEMHALFIAAQHRGFDGESLAEFHFLVVIDVAFAVEQGVAVAGGSIVAE